MKISVDVECTPEEARRFMGLPDLTSVHEAYLSKVRNAIDHGVTPETIKGLLQNWGPMGEASFSMWRKVMDQMSGSGSA